MQWKYNYDYRLPILNFIYVYSSGIGALSQYNSKY